VPTIRDQIQARLEALKKELETGQAELQKVKMQRTYLHETVLRISGAVQVLEELLGEGDKAGAAPAEKHPATANAGEAKRQAGGNPNLS
jgi:predicted nuclease with TOPRIM domain